MSFKSLSSFGSNSYDRRSNSQKSKASASAAAEGADKQGTSYKLVMVGDSGVGKSCLLEKLLDLTSTNTFISTIGVDVRTHVVNLDGHNLKLQVWDTGGQERYRPVLSSCYRNAHGVIVVFDITNEKSFSNLPQWMKEVDEFSTGKLPKLLIGNKCEMHERRQVNREKAEAFAKENQMGYIETSAIATVNITEAFIALIKESGGFKDQ